MKKGLMLLFAVTVTTIALTGCTMITTPVTSAPPGVIYSDVKSGLWVNPPVRPLREQYKVVKSKITGSAMSTSVLLIASFDDSSFAAAYRNALNSCPEADEIIDIKVDVKKRSILMLFNETTVFVTGTAIKYLPKDEKNKIYGSSK